MINAPLVEATADHTATTARTRLDTARVLIIDTDAAHAAELEMVLEAVGFYAVAFPDIRSALPTTNEFCADLMVVVLRSPLALPDALASIGSALRPLSHPPELLFLLRWALRGPEERLLADRWNVQVIYAP